MSEDRASILTKHGFTEYKTAEGRVYFHNTTTNESVWELPQNIIDEIDQLSNKSKNVIETNLKSVTDVSKYLKPETPLSNNDDDNAFVSLLKDNQVDATWSFNTVIEKLIGDKRYWSIKDPLKKQKLFDDYLQNRSHDELLKENNSLEKFQEAFIKILKDYNVTHVSRWSTIKQKISDESIYKYSVISEKVKRQTFEKYVNELKKQYEAEQSALKEKALNELNDYLKSLHLIKIESTWDEVLQFIKSDKRFEQNRHFEILNQLDLLKTFENIIKVLQLEELDKIKKLKEINYRHDRIQRDSFIALLNSLREQGKIRANTKWSDIYQLIKDEEGFIGLLGRTHSSNQYDLFQQAVKEEDDLINARRAVVEQLLIHNNVEIKIDESVDHDSQFNQIKNYLQKEPETSNYDDITLELIYEKLINEIKENKRREELRIKQQFAKDIERFKYFLSRFQDPVITKVSKWEDFSSKLTSVPEFQKLTPEKCQELFNEYVNILAIKEKELALERDQELKKLINEANSTAPGIPSRKRNIQQVVEPQEELDY